jgi:hypothetical protein
MLHTVAVAKLNVQVMGNVCTFPKAEQSLGKYFATYLEQVYLLASACPVISYKWLFTIEGTWDEEVG